MLRRNLPIARKKAIKRVLLVRRYKATGPSAETVAACLARAGGRCEICTGVLGPRRGVDFSLHHRCPRKMGGTKDPAVNSPTAVLVPCGSGTTGCHGRIESRRAEALANGWLVPQGGDPATVAVLIHRDRWVYLTDVGYADEPPEVAA